MADGSDESCTINFEYDDDTIRVRVPTPGLKTQWAGPPNKRKLDHKSADLSVSFENNEAHVQCTIKQGTLSGKVYNHTLTKDDLKDNLVAPEPKSYYKVADDEVRLYIHKM